MRIGVYKFGGASIANADRINNVQSIINKAPYDKTVVVISAMGKSTNVLEDVWRNRQDKSKTHVLISDILRKHIEVAELLQCNTEELGGTLKQISNLDSLAIEGGQHAAYDQIVSIGELMSTSIVVEYLKSNDINACWVDARSLVKTDSTYRAGNVIWNDTMSSVKNICTEAFANHDIVVTQGFIGSDEEGHTTTLGREGSDFTAAILAHCLDAEELAIWKDVKGILTADPRKFDHVVKLDRLSYTESIEMTYYGAKVIHPKTIRPLENKGIPLLVKSFLDPDEPGTMISAGVELSYPPIVVVEEDQVLLHFSAKDFSFIGEGHLGRLFQALDYHRLKVNLMKNSAKSFTVCVTSTDDRIEKLIEELSEEYYITIDPNLELLTIRHPNDEIVNSLKDKKVVLMEERASKTVQIVVKDAPLMIRK